MKFLSSFCYLSKDAKANRSILVYFLGFQKCSKALCIELLNSLHLSSGKLGISDGCM